MKYRQRKVVELDWRDDDVKGLRASISVLDQGSEEEVEIRNVENDGLAVVTFPSSFSGTAEVKVRGSKGGDASCTVTVA